MSSEQAKLVVARIDLTVQRGFYPRKQAALRKDLYALEGVRVRENVRLADLLWEVQPDAPTCMLASGYLHVLYRAPKEKDLKLEAALRAVEEVLKQSGFKEEVKLLADS